MLHSRNKKKSWIVAPQLDCGGLPWLAHGNCHGCGSPHFPQLTRLFSWLFDFQAISFVLCCIFVFKGLVLAASGGLLPSPSQN